MGTQQLSHAPSSALGLASTAGCVHPPAPRAAGLEGRHTSPPRTHTEHVPPLSCFPCARLGTDTFPQHPAGTAVDGRIRTCKQHILLPPGTLVLSSIPSSFPHPWQLPHPVDRPLLQARGQHLTHKGLSETRNLGSSLVNMTVSEQND